MNLASVFLSDIHFLFSLSLTQMSTQSIDSRKFTGVAPALFPVLVQFSGGFRGVRCPKSLVSRPFSEAKIQGKGSHL
jgi:hypothetical protein